MAKTSKIGLTTNLNTDPFLLSDFTNNWNILDSQPGFFPCTSSTRPSWGAAQAGRNIVETDTGRYLRWSGSAWKEPVLASPAWLMMSSPRQAVSAGTATTYTLGTIKVLRPCTLFIINTATAGIRNTAGQWVSTSTQVNGASATAAPISGSYLQWPSTVAGNTTQDFRTGTWFNTFVANAPGNYTVAHKVQASNGTGSPTLSSFSAMVICGADNGGASTL